MQLLIVVMLSTVMVIGLGGCISKPYVMTMDRVDQKMDVGNRGYLMGTPPPPEDRGELKRQFIAVDIDLPTTAGEEAAVETTPSIREAESAPSGRGTEITPSTKKEEEIK